MIKLDKKIFNGYLSELVKQIEKLSLTEVGKLADALEIALINKKQVFLIGNGGSGGNANHIANDFIYPISKKIGLGLKVHSLSSNPATISCLANDEGYDEIFSAQLRVLGEPGDILIALSGSGNSQNIIKCLDAANQLGITSFSMLGFDGGLSYSKSDHVIFFDTFDMQVCEDMQMVVANAILKELFMRISGDDSV